MKEQQISVAKLNAHYKRHCSFFKTEWTWDLQEFNEVLEKLKQAFPAPEFSITVNTRETKHTFEVVN